MLSESGCPGFKDEQDENRDFIAYYQRKQIYARIWTKCLK